MKQFCVFNVIFAIEDDILLTIKITDVGRWMLEDSSHPCTNKDLLLHQSVNDMYYIKPHPI